MKWIPNYECKYAIDEYGNIYSYKKGNSELKKLARHINRNGYPDIGLSLNGEIRTFRVHRLVADVYLGESKMIVNHKDGNKLNNHYSNLERSTHSKNTKHAYDMGLINRPKGEDSTSTKFTNNDIIRMREIHRSKVMSKQMIAEYFDTTMGCVKAIVMRKTWKHI